jgi:hypothetical protein
MFSLQRFGSFAPVAQRHRGLRADLVDAEHGVGVPALPGCAPWAVGSAGTWIGRRHCAPCQPSACRYTSTRWFRHNLPRPLHATAGKGEIAEDWAIRRGGRRRCARSAVSRWCPAGPVAYSSCSQRCSASARWRGGSLTACLGAWRAVSVCMDHRSQRRGSPQIGPLAQASRMKSSCWQHLDDLPQGRIGNGARYSLTAGNRPQWRAVKACRICDDHSARSASRRSVLGVVQFPGTGSEPRGNPPNDTRTTSVMTATISSRRSDRRSR